MHKEYAIDPNILISFDRIRAILGTCGWHKGKVVCEYPKRKWKKKVYKTCRVNGDREKKALEVMLASHSLCKRKNATPYNSNAPWLDSARAEHSRKPFAAILSNTSKDSSNVIDGRFITEDNEPLWAPPSGILPRTANDFATAISLLSQNSSRIIFIDPYFDCFAQRYTEPFTEMLKAVIPENYKRSVAQNQNGVTDDFSIELHRQVKCYDNVDSYETIASTLEHNIEQQLPRHIPTGLKVHVHLWKEHDVRTERLHNRYFLTDLGGLFFGIGLDISDPRNDGAIQNDDISILTKEQYQKHLNEYCRGSNCFELLKDFEVTGTLTV